MFPWESAFTGAEACPLEAATGLLEQHISADISIAVYNTFLATGDQQWFCVDGRDTITGVADFFVSRVTPTAPSSAPSSSPSRQTNLNSELSFGSVSYSIVGVIPPDEYAFNVTDSVYTNAAATRALEIALYASQLCGSGYATPAQVAAWGSVSDGLVILYNETLDIHPEYRVWRGKEYFDILCLLFLFLFFFNFFFIIYIHLISLFPIP